MFSDSLRVVICPVLPGRSYRKPGLAVQKSLLIALHNPAAISAVAVAFAVLHQKVKFFFMVSDLKTFIWQYSG
jgi:hypothetical protein